MKNYLEILKNSRNNIAELETDLKLVLDKIAKLENKKKNIHQDYKKIIDNLESLCQNLPESDHLLNNAAFWGLIVILTIIITFFCLQSFGTIAILVGFGGASTEAIGYILKEKLIKRKYEKIRIENAKAIAEEKENLSTLDEERKDVLAALRPLYQDKYSIEAKIRDEEDIISEILGYLAPLLDDLIAKDISKSELLEEAIVRIETR